MTKKIDLHLPAVGKRYSRTDDDAVYIPFYVDFIEIRVAPEGGSSEEIMTPNEFNKVFDLIEEDKK